MMGSVLFGLGIFVCGIMVGLRLKTMAYDQQDWQILKWESKLFAFQKVPVWSRLLKGDKIIMGLPIDTSEMTEDGVIVE